MPHCSAGKYVVIHFIEETYCLSGMVGAINAPTTGTNTFTNFQAAAAKFQGPSGVRMIPPLK